MRRGDVGAAWFYRRVTASEEPAQGTGRPTYRLVRPVPRSLPAPVLDPAQQAVVGHPGGPLLVLAGPGTGKTTTLVEAVVDRVTRRGVDPEQILVLTFSRRAAGELRDRVAARLARTSREPVARTFHSYAFGVLRRSAAERGARPPRLLSGPEQDLVVRELLLGDIESGSGRWPAALQPALGVRGFAAELRDLLLRAIERGIGPSQLAAWGKARGRDDWVAAAAFFGQYLDVTALAEADGPQAYDPAELIRAVVDELADPSLLARERAARRHIFVDEYQDVDPAQEQLLTQLGSGAEELIVVGDPDQSIYAFRGADADAIRRVPDVFAPPGGGEVPVIALGTCRRAGPALLAASRRVAGRLPGPVAHRTLSAADVTSGSGSAGRVEVHLLRTAGDEANYVARRLRAAHLLDGVPWREMAVLVRSTVRQLPALRRALTAAGVPVAVAADDLPLVAQPGVAPLLLLLRCAFWGLRLDGGVNRSRAHSDPLAQPDPLDENAAAELITSPLGAADALDVRRLRRELRSLAASPEPGPPAFAGSGIAGSIAGLLGDVRALADDGPAWAGPQDRAELAAAVGRVVGAAAGRRAGEPARRVGVLLALARRVARSGGSTEDVLWAIWSASGLADAWQRASLAGGPAGAHADRDLDAVVALFDAAAQFVDRLPRAGPTVFLEHLLGQQIPGDSLAARAPQGDAVRLLTAHAAKGLEWELVVVAGVQEGSWPDLRQRGTLLGSEQLVDLAAGREPAVAAPVAPLLAQERRLFYVAVTRARRSLLVTAVRGDDDLPSRFLDELVPLPHGAERPLTSVPRALSLPGLVAELRAVVADPKQADLRRRAAAAQLARLASAGVPGAHPDQWWGLAPLSDDRPLADPGEPVRLSPSQVDRFVDCELRWLLETIGARGADGPAQSVGTVLHDVAALAANPEFADEEALAQRLEQLLGQFDLGGAWTTRREHDRARAMLGRFVHWLAARRGGCELVGVEVPFAVPVGSRAVVHGRVDRLERDSGGRLVVVDLKTGRSKPTGEEVRRHAQLGVYQLAVEHGGFGEAAGAAGVAGAAGAAVSGGAGLVHLGQSSKGGPVEQWQEPLGADDEPGWAEDLVERAAAGMAGASFRAIPSSFCRVCPARISCPAHDLGRQVTQ
jgi:superfamily I DNA/RNA helicase/RecB family exonuclease